MDPAALTAALVAGFVAGMASGLLGIGGGILFVPALVFFLSQSQLEAEATSLVAVVMVAVAGTARQRRHGNLRLGEGLFMGLLSPLGVLVGAIAANTLPERALAVMFAGVQLYFAYRLGRRALGPKPEARAS